MFSFPPDGLILPAPEYLPTVPEYLPAVLACHWHFPCICISCCYCLILTNKCHSPGTRKVHFCNWNKRCYSFHKSAIIHTTDKASAPAPGSKERNIPTLSPRKGSVKDAASITAAARNHHSGAIRGSAWTCTGRGFWRTGLLHGQPVTDPPVIINGTFFFDPFLCEEKKRGIQGVSCPVWCKAVRSSASYCPAGYYGRMRS